MNNPSSSQMGWIGKTAQIISHCLIAYWTIFVLVAPVTVWDAHVYNLGRLPLIEIGGLWNNPYWTTERQLVFPLSFDAIHLPFLHLGFAYALPSFLCFIGILLVTWNTLNRWYGQEAGWLGVLALLGLPTLAFQAVGTKNDIAILFGLAIWTHAMTRWKSDAQRQHHLVFAALSIGFMIGAKTSGFIPAAFCTITMLWILRRKLKTLAWVLATLLGSVLLLGSIETYIASAHRYDRPMGPEQFIREHSNNDGVRGATANALRYTMANICIGSEPYCNSNPSSPWFQQQCRYLLQKGGLANVGYRHDYNDNNLVFLSNSWDASSDYGPLGTLCIGIALLALCCWRPNEPWWQLAFAALIIFAAVCYTVAWMPWNNRFLIVPFTLLALSLVSFLQRRKSRLLSTILLLVSAYGAIVYPLTSFNKRPADLFAALTKHEEQEFKERPSLLPVIAAVREWRTQHPGGEVLLIAGGDSWILPFLTSGLLAVRPVTLNELLPALKKNLTKNAPTLVLVLNRADFRRAGLPLIELTRFKTEADTAIYTTVGYTDQPAYPRVSWISGHGADGWILSQAILEVENWSAHKLSLELWNPTPLVRSVRLFSSSDHVEINMQPDEHRNISLAVAVNDNINLTISPEFIPKALGKSTDTRTLGVIVYLVY